MPVSISFAVLRDSALQRTNGSNSTRHKPKGLKRLGLMMLALIGLTTCRYCAAQEVHWNGNAGNGQFFDGNNWSPVGPPQNSDIIRIGNLPGTAGANVMMSGAAGIVHDGLYLSNGVTLDMNGSELVSFHEVSVTGNNTRLIARPVPFFHPHDFQGQLQLGSGAHFELRDDVPVIFSPASSFSGTISGRGSILTGGFVNDGVIQPGANGGLVINAGFPAAPYIDLDGTSGLGSLVLTTQFSQLNVHANNLADSFGGHISMAPGALLNMNINEGWTSDANSSISVLGFSNPAAASVIDGTAWTMGGSLDVTLAQGHLRILAPTTVQSSATVNVGHTDHLEFDGPTTVQGGTFTLGQFGQMQFDGETTLSGGAFSTYSGSFGDGTIAFNGPTTWNGNVTIEGVARQQGNATVSGLGATINATRFDMDGLSGNTTWNINSGLVVSAEMTGTTSANRFQGTLNVAGGILPRLTMNLADPEDAWIMAGEMNLAGHTQFYETRVAGSSMTVEGLLNVTGGRVRIDADTTFSDNGFAGPAQVSIAGADTEMRMHGQTLVESGVDFAGSGSMINAASGTFVLESGLQLNDIGLVNSGLVRIANGAGVASVDRFTHTGTWEIEIGGYLAGAEHDLLLVTGGLAHLGGILNVDLIESVGPDFFPEVGDEFTILSALAGISGTFAADPATLFQGQTYHWSVQYNPHDVTLQLTAITIPEPAAGLLLIMGGLVFGWRRSRRASPVNEGSNQTRYRIRLGLSTPTMPPQTSRPGLRGRFSLSCLLFTVPVFGSASQSQAQQVDWNAGVGVWSNGANWDPVGVPVAIDHVTIGNGSSAMVNLNQQAEIASLSIFSGGALNTQSDRLNVNGDMLVSGFGGFAGLTPSRLIVGSRDGLSIRTENLAVSQGATVQFEGGIADIYDRLTIDGFSGVGGPGIINLFRTGTSLTNDGTIEAGTNYGLIINQLNGGGYDLDGVGGNGIMRVTDYDSANNWGARLRLEGTHLSDSFSGQLIMGSGGGVAMNLSEGWTVDSGGEFLVGWSPHTIEAARITGGALDFSGEINMLGSDGIVASDLEINSSQIRVREAARVDTSYNNVLSLGGNATSLVRVDGGEFTVGEYGRIEFNAPTEIRGGTFQTFSSQLFDFSGGAVVFNGDTLWSGTTILGGAARQNGTATVNGLGATIHADSFDLDGLIGDTTWNIHSSLVINAAAIDEMTMGFNGTLNIAGGALPRLTLNLANPSDSWSMEGEMNLSGVSHLYETRVAGSTMIVAGQLHVTGGRVRINADTTYSDSGPLGPAQVSIGPADAALRMHGNTVVHEGVEFSGHGTFVNATSGQILFHNGVTLNDIGLENHGDFEIGELTGVASVDRFANMGSWTVDIGGYLAGAGHDLLLVSGATELGGWLEVRMTDEFDLNFLPEIGDEFTILYSGGSLSGTFLNDPTSSFRGQTYHWDVLYNPHDLTLQLTGISAIPEPACGMVLVGVSMWIFRFRRRSGFSTL